MTAVHKMMTKQ